MSFVVNSLTVNGHDPRRVAGFWSAVLDWPILFDYDEEADVEGNEFCVLQSLPKERAV